MSDVVEVTGFSFHTARQYLAQTQHLLRVAATVLSSEQETGLASGD